MHTHWISLIFLFSLALVSCSPFQAAIEDTPTLTSVETNIVPPLTPDITAPTAYEVAATIPTSTVNATDDWKTYHNTQAGYNTQYPADWTVNESAGINGGFTTIFMAPSDGQGITVSVFTSEATLEEIPDIPNTRCQQVTISGYPGRRCLDTVAFSLSTSFLGQGKQYAIAAIGKHPDQNIYQRFMESFTVTP